MIVLLRIPTFVRAHQREIAMASAALAIVIALGLVAARYVRWRAQGSAAEPIQAELGKVVDKVRRHVLLPQGEEPTIAVVSDIGPLRSQPFFAEARLGDYVLVYPKARRAVLYDPQADLVVNMAPLADGAAAPPSVAATTTVNLKP